MKVAAGHLEPVDDIAASPAGATKANSQRW